MGTDVHLDEMRHLLHAGEVRRALEYLHLISPYRFAAIYRIDADDLHNIVFVDREDPSARRLPSIPKNQSYCEIVESTRDAFLLEDSACDARVVAHPKREVVRSYLGVPLLAGDGTTIGTICLFDYAAVPANPYVLDLLSEIATALDPEQAMADTARDLDDRTNALAAMAELIAGASEDWPSALDAFNDYASPIRTMALTRLDEARRARLEERLQQLADGLHARFAPAIEAGPG